jgi:hypothetical protein
MQQVFRDRYRDEARRNRRSAIAVYWMRTLLDLIPSAAREHSENLRKDHTMRRDIVSLVGCICIILIAFTLLSYGRTHEVSAILVFGRTLDAIVTTGIIGNLLVFILIKTTRQDSFGSPCGRSSLSTACWQYFWRSSDHRSSRSSDLLQSCSLTF